MECTSIVYLRSLLVIIKYEIDVDLPPCVGYILTWTSVLPLALTPSNNVASNASLSAQRYLLRKLRTYSISKSWGFWGERTRQNTWKKNWYIKNSCIHLYCCSLNNYKKKSLVEISSSTNKIWMCQNLRYENILNV